jgi:hypothetical protein
MGEAGVREEAGEEQRAAAWRYRREEGLLEREVQAAAAGIEQDGGIRGGRWDCAVEQRGPGLECLVVVER